MFCVKSVNSLSNSRSQASPPPKTWCSVVLCLCLWSILRGWRFPTMFHALPVVVQLPHCHTLRSFSSLRWPHTISNPLGVFYVGLFWALLCGHSGSATVLSSLDIHWVSFKKPGCQPLLFILLLQTLSFCCLSVRISEYPCLFLQWLVLGFSLEFTKSAYQFGRHWQPCHIEHLHLRTW